MQCVQVKLELGHRAYVRRDGPTPEGFTHDWCVFVRGPEGSKIEHYVDKVVFYLHESFKKPKRVFKEPPYQVEESGYAGFHMPIDVYFKNKEEPKKIRFEYNLFLNPEQQPSVNHLRCEKLTFQNPTEDFRKKLLKANGVAISLNHSSHVKESTEQPSPIPSHNQTKLVKHPGKEPYKGNSSSRTTPTPQKENKSTPVKDSKHQEPKPLQKRMSPSSSDRSLSPVVKKSKVVEDSKHSDKVSSKDKSKLKSHKHRKEKDKEKKKDHSKDSEKKHKSEGKDKLKTSTEMVSHIKDAEPVKRKDSESKSGTSKPNLAPAPRSSGNSSLGTLLAELGDEPDSDEELISPLSDDHSPVNPFSSHAGSQSATSSPKPQIQKASNKGDKPEKSKTSIESSPSKQKAQIITPKSSESKVASLSETNVKSKSTKHENGSFSHKIDVKKEKVEAHREHSKKSSESKKISKHKEETKKPVQVKTELNDSKETKGNISENLLKSVNGDASSQMQHCTAFNNLSNTSFAGLNDKKTGDGFDLAELLDLQRKLMMLRDRECLQRIVDVVEETGLFDITSTTFDFDLCSLDKATLTKLQKCICDVPDCKHEAQSAKVS